MPAHHEHRKSAIAYQVNTYRRWWRWYIRIGKLLEAKVEYEKRG